MQPSNHLLAHLFSWLRTKLFLIVNNFPVAAMMPVLLGLSLGSRMSVRILFKLSSSLHGG